MKFVKFLATFAVDRNDLFAKRKIIEKFALFLKMCSVERNFEYDFIV